MNELFNPFPLARLAARPTPVARLEQIGKIQNHTQLFVKQDNLSAPFYGGNKIRKLEFLLGEALEQKRKSVITYGATGSNHALATAICCRELGLKAISILAPQEPSDHVLKNLRAQQAAGAEIIQCGNYTEFPGATKAAQKRCQESDGIEPYIIPAGGTNAVGALGFVNAAFELAEQLQPDIIYLPMGTGGTLAGLLVGLKLTGLAHTRIEAIRVVEPAFRNETHILQLCGELCEKLGVEPCITAADIHIRNEFFGAGYGIPTPEAQYAVDHFREQENIALETTYTGKTTAALLHDLQSGSLQGQTICYWNTLNSRALLT